MLLMQKLQEAIETQTWPVRDDITDLEVDLHTCIPTYPCKHHVTVNGQKETWSAPQIVQTLTHLGRPVPSHFDAWCKQVERRRVQ